VPHNQRLDLGFFEQFFQCKSISRVTSGLKERRDTRGPGRISQRSTGVAKFRATGQSIDEFWAWLALLTLGILKRILYLRDSAKTSGKMKKPGLLDLNRDLTPNLFLSFGRVAVKSFAG